MCVLFACSWLVAWGSRYPSTCLILLGQPDHVSLTYSHHALVLYGSCFCSILGDAVVSLDRNQKERVVHRNCPMQSWGTGLLLLWLPSVSWLVEWSVPCFKQWDMLRLRMSAESISLIPLVTVIILASSISILVISCQLMRKRLPLQLLIQRSMPSAVHFSGIMTARVRNSNWWKKSTCAVSRFWLADWQQSKLHLQCSFVEVSHASPYHDDCQGLSLQPVTAHTGSVQ